MDGPRDHLLAHSALSREQHGHVGVGGAAHNVLDRPHALAAAEEKVQVVGGAVTLRDGNLGQIERGIVTIPGETTSHGLMECLRQDRFDQEITCSGPDGLDR